MRRWMILNVLLALIVGLLAVEIVRTWARTLEPIAAPSHAPAEPTAPPRDKRRGGGDKGAGREGQVPGALVVSIIEKDLFDVSRRPPPVSETPPQEVVKVVEPPTGVTVVGVRIYGKDREVFVTDASQPNGGQRRLRVGDEIGGYIIKAIEPTEVTLSSPSGDPITMALQIDKGGPQGAPQGATPRGAPGRAGQAQGSPAAGVSGASPAAGVGVTPPVPPGAPGFGVPGAPPGVARPGAQPPGVPGGRPQQPLPANVQRRLEQLKRNPAGPGAKGAKR